MKRVINQNSENRRGRKPMTEAEKAQARNQREQSSVNRDAAIEAINTNDQFTDPKTWAALAPSKLTEVKAAIAKVEGRIRKNEMDALRKRLAALEAESK